MTNFVEAGKAAESLTDDGLKQAANFGHPMVPPIVALTEITRRKEMRERYQKARNKMPDATIKDQILGANPLDGGVMSNVPQAQMAARPPMPQPPMQPPMNPQMMAQRPPMPPQMPPQGMMPQMASTGAVVRASNGQRIDFNEGTPVDTIDGRLVDFRGEMQRLAEEREMWERIARTRSERGYSNEYLGEENIDQLVGDNILWKDFVKKQDEEAFLNPSNQGLPIGNAVREDGAKFTDQDAYKSASDLRVDEMPTGYGELGGGGIDPNWKTMYEKVYGGEQILTSVPAIKRVDVEKDNNKTNDNMSLTPVEDLTKDIRSDLRKDMTAEELDLSELYPSKDEVLSDFLMNYGAKLAGGDHAGGLESGIAAVSGRKKERRALQQAEKIANLKSRQDMQKQSSDNLYRSGDLAIRQAMATTNTLEERGRALRAVLEDRRTEMILPTFKSKMRAKDKKLGLPDGTSALRYEQETENIQTYLTLHARGLMSGISKSSGGIASIR